MKGLIRRLLICALAVCTFSTGAFASTVTTDSSSFALKNGEKTCAFSVILHADESFAGAEFGIKPSAGDVTLTSEFVDVKSESTVRTVKNGVTYFGFFAGSNKFAPGDYTVAKITCTYAGTGSRRVDMVSSKIVTIDAEGSTSGDTGMAPFSVAITREGATGGGAGGGGASGGGGAGGGGASGGGGAGGGGGGGAVTPAPQPVTVPEEVKPTGEDPAATANQGVSKFSDVSKSDFCYNSVDWAMGKGITSGTDSSHFSPKKTCTRAETLTFMWRYSGSKKASVGNPFTDLKREDYYFDAALWALETGISNGNGDNTMAGVANCDRGQVVTMLWRMAGCPEPKSTVNPFTDLSESDFCYKAVLWAVEKGITKGNGNNTFAGVAVCDRGQIVTFLHRFSQL